MTALLLKRVRLEESFEYTNEQIVATNTGIYDVLITNDVITEIAPQIEVADDIEVFDAQCQLLLPAFREMHIHLDKTYFGGEWQAPSIATNGIQTRIDEEKILLPKQLPTAAFRAEKIVQMLIAQGHTHIRSHCNVDQQIGTKHVELVKEVLEKYRGQITYDIVAFPQHGLLKSEVLPLMKEAMQLGATLVGGVDPATVDRDIERSLQQMMDIAVEYNAGVDIHLHDGDTLGAFEIKKLAALTKEAGKQGHVTVSHAFALAGLEQSPLNELIAQMAEVQMDVTSTVPIGLKSNTIPIPYLWENGIRVSVGHDSLVDHWSPFGTGNTITKLNILAERFRYIDEYSINRTWKYASGGITPLNDAGERVWPKVGDAANMLLLDGVSTAHVVARRCPITTVISNGNIIHQSSIELKGVYR
ncbi:amidohydrolase [Solibacillus sp. CAU 1738]|uniref:amidohydrolase n=1 Tax=Solibacillus sp. CAU 1738 TaxID=3140363 RepID=UPI0032601D44